MTPADPHPPTTTEEVRDFMAGQERGRPRCACGLIANNKVIVAHRIQCASWKQYCKDFRAWEDSKSSHPHAMKDTQLLDWLEKNLAELNYFSGEWLCYPYESENALGQTPRAAIRTALANGSSKLTDEQVRDIKTSPLGSTTIGRKYGVHRNCVLLIRSGQRWSHIK